MINAGFTAALTAAQLNQYHLVTEDLEHDLTSFTKHPSDENSLLASDKESIYHLDLATQVYTLLTIITEAYITDIEWLTTSDGSFLAISNKNEDCIQSMDIFSLLVVEYFGQCGVKTLETNTDFANTGLKDPDQLGFNEKEEILYVSVAEEDGLYHLLRCSVKNDFTRKVIESSSSALVLPSSSKFYFSFAFDNTLIVSDTETDKVSLLTLPPYSRHVEVIGDQPLGAKHIAYVGNVSVAAYDEKLWVDEYTQLCVYDRFMRCNYLQGINFFKQISPFRMVVYDDNEHVHVVGTDRAKPASTSMPVTNRLQLARNDTRGHFRLSVIQRGGMCIGTHLKDVVRVSSVELCGYMCVKNRSCQALAYGVMTNNCHLYAVCESVADMENMDCYRVVLV